MIVIPRLPPHGGSGLKSVISSLYHEKSCLPPHGGSGLKYNMERWKRSLSGLPPHGGSGLKYFIVFEEFITDKSSSTWRKWIEIHSRRCKKIERHVFLHMEEVD